METVSTGAAIGAGFRLIGREPLAFLVWVAAYLLIGVLPQLWAVSQILPSIAEIIEMSRGDAEPTAEQMMAINAGMIGLQPVLFLTGIISQTVILGAVYRAILLPEERRFFYLRVGARELWLALVSLVLVVLAIIAMIVVMLPVGIVSGILGASAPDAANWLIPILLIAVAVLAVWAALRMSMAPVMSFARSNFSLFESWGFTRGQALSMFGVALVIVLIAFVIGMLVYGAIIAGVLLSLPGTMAAAAWMDDPEELLRSIGPPLIIGAVLVGSLHRTFAYVLFGGAWARMYADLSASDEAAA